MRSVSVRSHSVCAASERDHLLTAAQLPAVQLVLIDVRRLEIPALHD